MGSRRGPEQAIGQNFKMKLLLTLCLLGLAAGSEDYKMFMKWAKTKAMESCWGEDNMKIHTVNMKKAVAKCNQQDAPELDLPPFRAITRMINNLVGMAGHKEDEHHEMESFMKFYRYMQMMNMMNHDDDDHHQENDYVMNSLCVKFNGFVNELINWTDDHMTECCYIRKKKNKPEQEKCMKGGAKFTKKWKKIMVAFSGGARNQPDGALCDESFVPQH